MGRFQGFYTGVEIAEENTSYSETGVFARRRQKEDYNRVSSRQLKIWQSDFDKCSTLTDYQNYINKYNSPDNPCISEAKQKIDDLTFSNCKSVADYNNYLALFPSGKNVIKAKAALRTLQTNASKSTSTKTSTYTSSSHNSNISGEDVWGVIKKIIGVIVILPLLALIYLCITGEGKWTMVGGYGLFIVTPVCKWAFDS